jgi:hypothetical protein
MKKRIFILLFILSLTVILYAQQVYLYRILQPVGGASITGNTGFVSVGGITPTYASLSWTINGSLATCTIQVDYSTDGSTIAGQLISAQTCTSSGSIIAGSNSSPAYVRVSYIIGTGGGYLNFVGQGCVNSTCTGGGASCTGAQYLGGDGVCHNVAGWIDIQTKGALGNGQVVRDVVTNGTTTVTSASALFVAGDVGKSVICVGCNVGVNLVTTVAGFTSSSSITLGGSPALTLPINIICVGCTTVPYGYATVSSAGAITGGVIVANGTASAASCTVKILMQQSQTGSGGALNCAVSGGVVSALTVGTAGAGYFATLYWATDDSTAIAAAMTAASAIQGCVYVPQAQKSFYMMNTQLTWAANTCIFGQGRFTRSYILGDPCTASCTTFLASSLILRNGTANQEMWNLHLDNVHAISASATDAFQAVVDCEHCGQGFDRDLQITAGRDVLHASSSAGATASNMRHAFIYCSGVTDACIDYRGASGQTSPNVNVEVTGGHFLNMICTLLGPNPCHDVFFEDTGQITVGDNYISDPADSSQVNEGFFGYAINHVTAAGGSSYLTVHDNTIIEQGPSVTSTLNAFTLSDATGALGVQTVDFHDNTSNGASIGFSLVGLNNTMSLGNFNIHHNNFQNCGWNIAGCIVITSTNCCVPINGTISGNTVFGPATSPAGTGPCLSLTLMGNVNITGNNLTWCGQYGILFSGTEQASITGNTIFNNSQSSTGTYDGIFLQSSGATNSFSNIISANNIFDNQGTQTQRYGINFAIHQIPPNKIVGNIFGIGSGSFGNKTANINDSTVGAGTNNCTWYESTIGCDAEIGSIASLGVTTLVPASFNSNINPLAYTVKIIWDCAAVATSTLQFQVNYSEPVLGATNQLGPSHACTAANSGIDIFGVRSTGANVISYQAIVANAPSFRDVATVQLQ